MSVQKRNSHFKTTREVMCESHLSVSDGMRPELAVNGAFRLQFSIDLSFPPSYLSGPDEGSVGHCETTVEGVVNIPYHSSQSLLYSE